MLAVHAICALLSADKGVITCKAVGNAINVALDPWPYANIIAYTWCASTLLLISTLNAIGFLTFYMMKEKVLDPIMPWNDEDGDDHRAMAKIRCTNILFTAGFVVVTSICKVYPKTYYHLIGDQRSFSELPIGTKMISLVQLILFLTYTVSLIGTTIYRPRRMSRRSKLLPHFIALLLAGFAFFSVSNVTTRQGYLWGVMQFLVTIGGVFVPTYMILTTEHLRAYVKRNVVIRASTIFEGITFIIFKQRSSAKVEPTI